MAGSPNATLRSAGTRGLVVAIVAGACAWLSAYLVVDDSCPSGKASSVSASQNPGKADRVAKKAADKEAKAARSACLKKVDKQKKRAVLAGLGGFLAAFGVRGAGEGLLDRKRQVDGNVKPSDVQVSGGPPPPGG